MLQIYKNFHPILLKMFKTYAQQNNPAQEMLCESPLEKSFR